MVILVTGSNGMIGSKLVDALLGNGYTVLGIDRTENRRTDQKYQHFQIDLGDTKALYRIIHENHTDRIIHLAALAHTDGELDLTWERYYHVNVDCAKNVFEVSGEKPVLFISTVDVYGFFDDKEPVNGATDIHPISKYGRSKAIAEDECRKLPHYTIFRFSPVYTDTIKRDIQKRYYLKYPNIAYQVGKGTAFEVLNVKRAVAEMVNWCKEEPKNDIRIIKDERPLWTPDYIKTEKAEGRAKTVLHIPKWMVNCGYGILKAVMGENEKTYLLNKLVHPLRSE